MDNFEKLPLIIISGPTGSGKTALSIELAKRLNGEIISADSVQVYRGFDIGSAKPGRREMAQVPHHLISILEPDEPFDAARFVERAETAITDIRSRGRLPFIVGGTGLYIRALLSGLVPMPEGSAESLGEARMAIASFEATERKAILAAAPLSKDSSVEAQIKRRLHEWLTSVDPESAARIRPADGARIRRALLVKLALGESLTELQNRHANRGGRHRALIFALLPDRATLYQAIDSRVDEMIDDGLVAEVEILLRRYPRSCRAFSAIGYKQIVDLMYSRGDEADFVAAVDAIKRDSRRFAKRQVTWWRNQPELLGWHQSELDGKSAGVSSSYGELVNLLPDKIAEFIGLSNLAGKTGGHLASDTDGLLAGGIELEAVSAGCDGATESVGSNERGRVGGRSRPGELYSQLGLFTTEETQKTGGIAARSEEDRSSMGEPSLVQLIRIEGMSK